MQLQLQQQRKVKHQECNLQVTGSQRLADEAKAESAVDNLHSLCLLWATADQSGYSLDPRCLQSLTYARVKTILHYRR